MTTLLRLERTFDAPRERVFAAWTNPALLARWWAAGPGWGSADVELDLRVGGRYRLTMNEPAGASYSVSGEYTLVDPPSRLAYTWAWEGLGMPVSQVTVDFLADGARTRVVVTHEGLGEGDGPASRAGHEHGWNACLDSLERTLT